MEFIADMLEASSFLANCEGVVATFNLYVVLRRILRFGRIQLGLRHLPHRAVLQTCWEAVPA